MKYVADHAEEISDRRKNFTTITLDEFKYIYNVGWAVAGNKALMGIIGGVVLMYNLL